MQLRVLCLCGPHANECGPHANECVVCPVFQTGMVGYPEALTDPSYRCQMLTLTYPLVGNYGVPSDEEGEFGLSKVSYRSKVLDPALVLVWVCSCFLSGLSRPRSTLRLSSSGSCRTLPATGARSSRWTSGSRSRECLESKVRTTRDERRRGTEQNFSKDKPDVETLTVDFFCLSPGIDTRRLTKKIREKGTMLGKLLVGGTPEDNIPFDNPDQRNLVQEVSMKVMPPHQKVRNRSAPKRAPAPHFENPHLHPLLSFWSGHMSRPWRTVSVWLSSGAQGLQPQWDSEDHRGRLWHQIQPDPLSGPERSPCHRRALGPRFGQLRSVTLSGCTCVGSLWSECWWSSWTFVDCCCRFRRPVHQ